MGAQSTNQHLTVFVSTYVQAVGGAFPVGAPVTVVEELLPGMTTYMAVATGACTATPPASPAVYKIAHKNSAGDVFFSGDLVGPVTAKAYAAAVQPVQTLLVGTVVVGDQFVVKLNVPNYGGLLSQQDDVNFYGNYTVQAGDDANAVALALRASLAAALTKATVSFAVVSGATNAIIVTGVAQPYEQARWSGRLVSFNLEMASPESAWAAATNTALGSPGFGTGNRVAEQEEFYAGYNTGYKNRFADWPRVTLPVLDAVVSHTYDAATVVGNGAQNTGTPNETTQRQTVIAYFDLDGTAVPLT
jgi:hypothetical protein